ncbi:MAG TPA: MBOAT family protein [Verrucomicrobiae bacterium]|nr:MBOAT family protein [Verrucomicrobiae bacterium]
MSRISKDIVEFFPAPAHKNRFHIWGTGFWHDLFGWLPLLILTAIAWIFRNAVPSWVFMWTMALALFFGCKWLTWWQCPVNDAAMWRHWAYLFAWPGMDASAFLDPHRHAPRPELREWIAAMLKTFFGAAMVWEFAKLAPEPLLMGWSGLIGCVFLLHFGTFHLLALGWQALGADAQPIMRAPILAKSLAEFWGVRWNAAFNLLVHKLIFRKLFRHVGVIGATLAVFFVSGLIHDLLLSIPARGGYGLPTLYFLLQGLGLCLENWKPVKKWTQGHPLAHRSFTIAVTAIPAFWLFHPPFIRNVILPMLHAIGAT